MRKKKREWGCENFLLELFVRITFVFPCLKLNVLFDAGYDLCQLCAPDRDPPDEVTWNS